MDYSLKNINNMADNCGCGDIVLGWDSCAENKKKWTKIGFVDLVASDGTENVLTSSMDYEDYDALQYHEDPTKRWKFMSIHNATLDLLEQRTATTSGNVSYLTDGNTPFVASFIALGMPIQLAQKIRQNMCSGKGYVLIDESDPQMKGSNYGTPNTLYPTAIQEGTFKVTPYNGADGELKSTTFTFTESPAEGMATYAEMVLDAFIIKTLKPVSKVNLSDMVATTTTFAFKGVLDIATIGKPINYAKSGFTQYNLYNVTDESVITITASAYNSTTNLTTLTFTAQTAGDVLRLQIAGGGYISNEDTATIPV